MPSDDNYRLALLDIASLEDVSIVAAPGAAAYAGIAQAINARLIAHAAARRAYRIAVLDTPPEQTPGEARAVRSLIDSKYAALYYPWVIVPNPLARPGRDDIPREIVAAAVGLRLRHLRAQRRRARRLQGAGQRGGAQRAPLRDRRQLRPAGGAQPARHQLPALASGRGYRRVGRAH